MLYFCPGFLAELRQQPFLSNALGQSVFELFTIPVERVERGPPWSSGVGGDVPVSAGSFGTRCTNEECRGLLFSCAAQVPAAWVCRKSDVMPLGRGGHEDVFGLEQCCPENYRGKKEKGKRRELQCSSFRSKKRWLRRHGEGCKMRKGSKDVVQ